MYGRSPVDRLAHRLGEDGSAKILFVSNHGAARALIAESIVNRHRASGFTAISAGVSPECAPHPMAEELLRAYRLPAPQHRPISLEEALDARAPVADFVVALWDRSCGEPSPTPPLNAPAAAWDVPDPRRPFNAGAGIIGSRLGFVRAYLGLRQRIEHFFADVAEEQRSIGAPPVEFSAVNRNDARPPLADLALGEDDAPESLQIGRREPPAQSARRPWSWGGVFTRRTASHSEAAEPLSLGRAHLVRDQRRPSE